jgi:cyanate permease
MVDSSLMGILSVVPLLIIVMAMAAAVIAWLSGRRAVRTAVAILLIVVGITSLLRLACSFRWPAAP